MRLVASAILAAAIFVAALPAAAAAALDPSAPVLAFHNGLAVMSHKDPAADLRLVRRLAPKCFDIDALTRTVMGAGYDKATPAQRARLADVFLRRLTARIEKDPTTGPGAVMTVVKVTSTGAGVWLVSARTTRGRAVTALTWRVRAEPGGPRIVDVLRAGASVTVLEHNVFQQELRGHDLAWAIADLERKAN